MLTTRATWAYLGLCRARCLGVAPLVPLSALSRSCTHYFLSLSLRAWSGGCILSSGPPLERPGASTRGGDDEEMLRPFLCLRKTTTLLQYEGGVAGTVAAADAADAAALLLLATCSGGVRCLKRCQNTKHTRFSALHKLHRLEPERRTHPCSSMHQQTWRAACFRATREQPRKGEHRTHLSCNGCTQYGVPSSLERESVRICRAAIGVISDEDDERLVG